MSGLWLQNAEKLSLPSKVRTLIYNALLTSIGNPRLDGLERGVLLLEGVRIDSLEGVGTDTTEKSSLSLL